MAKPPDVDSAAPKAAVELGRARAAVAPTPASPAADLAADLAAGLPHAETGRIADVRVGGFAARVHRGGGGGEGGGLPGHELGAWRASLAGSCHDHRYFDLAQRELTDRFEHLQIVLADDQGRTRAVQPAFITREDLLTGAPPRLAAMLAPIRRVWPGFLRPRMLMVGCATGEGVLAGATEDDRRWAGAALARVLRPLARQLKAGLIVLKDFPSEHRAALDGPMAGAGFARLPSMPGAGLALNFTSFDDYLTKLCSKSRRADLRRKFRDAVKDGPIELSVVSDITPWIDEAYPLYLQVYERSSLRFEKLTPGFLCGLGQALPDRVRYFIWRRGGRGGEGQGGEGQEGEGRGGGGQMVAFNLCLLHDGVLRDCYIGLDYAVALDLHLYFLSWRDIIEWCIRHGVTRYWTAPLNYDPKLNLRMRLEPLDLYTRCTPGLLNPLFRRVVKHFGPTRFDPVLPKFANFGDL